MTSTQSGWRFGTYTTHSAHTCLVLAYARSEWNEPILFALRPSQLFSPYMQLGSACIFRILLNTITYLMGYGCFSSCFWSRFEYFRFKEISERQH